jgi:hypothetical membrane protein
MDSRILRIWPLYFAALLELILLGHFLRGAGPLDPASWLAFTFFAGNWYICGHGWIPVYPAIGLDHRDPISAMLVSALGPPVRSFFFFSFDSVLQHDRWNALVSRGFETFQKSMCRVLTEHLIYA